MSDIIMAIWLSFSAIVLLVFLLFFIFSQNRNYTKLLEIEKELEKAKKSLAKYEHS